MTALRALFLCVGPLLLLACSGTIAVNDHEPLQDAGLDGSDGDDAGDAGFVDAGGDVDGGDEGDADEIVDAGGVDGFGDAEDAGALGDEDPLPDRCPPLSENPPVHACLAAGWTDFTLGNLLVLDSPSMASAGMDFVLEITPEGVVAQTVVPQSNNILGARDLLLDPLSGNLLYSVSDWTGQIFEIREVDANGTLLNTLEMPTTTNGGNIAMAFDHLGALHVAYDGAVYKMPAGDSTLAWWLDFPEGVGLGEIDLDRRGNLYLTDPFTTESVIRFAPDGSHCTLAGPEEGLASPYGLCITPNDEVYVTGFDPESHDCQIRKIDPTGTVSLAADDVAAAGSSIRGLDTDATGQLYATVEGPQSALLKIHADGSHEVVASEAQGLVRPANVVSVSTPYPCE
ncbi:MAG: hypothetical protein JRF33_17125 [Deltaproteobacteria bacterium]|nr:hypothetical protein [Deltaproteobacteria bacterium]